jgi:hypothetical protein
MTSPQTFGDATISPVSPAGPEPCSVHVRSPASVHGQPQRERRAGSQPPFPLAGGKRLCRARIERRAVGIARPRPLRLARLHQGCNLGATLKTRIEQPERGQPVERRPIIGKMVRLPPNRRLPGYPEPAEVLTDRRFEFGPAAGRVDVLDPQQKPSPDPLRGIEIQQRRTGVPEMQKAVR